MKTKFLTLLAAATFVIPAAASADVTFSNDFSFTTFSKSVVKGTLSGLTNGTNVSATGLSLTITQYPASFSLPAGFLSPASGTYSASNGLLTSNTYILFSGLKGGYFYFTAPYNGLDGAEIAPTSGYSTLNADSTGVTFIAAASTTAAAAGAIPEPASWAMMILGMGMVGYALRRRVRASEVEFDARIKRIAAGLTA